MVEAISDVCEKVMGISLRGARLQSNFPVDSGEMLDISLALGDDLISFKERAIGTALSEGHGFELGVSIEDIEDKQRVTLTRFMCQLPNLVGG